MKGTLGPQLLVREPPSVPQPGVPQLSLERPPQDFDDGTMDRLPYEIVTHIFLKTTGVIGLTRSGNDIDSVQTPLYISHVSRSWRNISLSCGELWSYLYLEFCANDNPRKRKRKMEIFYVWLSRTNGAPINFWIFVQILGSHYDELLELDAEKVIVTLLSQQQRWKDVSFVWRGLNLTSDFPDVFATDMPLLSRLHLFVRMGRARIKPVVFIDISRSRRLKSLQLECQFVLGCGREPIASLEGPGELDFEETRFESVSESVSFLKIAPNLKAFVVVLANVENGVSECPEHGRLSHNLRSLCVTSRSSSGSHFIDQITLPYLELFRFAQPPYESNGLLEFIQRSLPPLTLLELDLKVVETTLVSILQLLPSLLHLRIATLDFSARVFRDLTPTSDHRPGKPLCPKLQSFSLRSWRDVNHEEAWYQSLTTMAKSRCEVMKTFKRVVFRPGTGYPKVGLELPELNWNDLAAKGSISYVHISGDAFPPDPFGDWVG